MIRRALLLSLAMLAATTVPVETMMAATMKWPDLFALPRPAPDVRIAYGADPLQHVELWLPKGRGPFRVVLMVHGGCWQSDIAKADIMDWIAGDLRGRGIAVWNVDYRGVDRPGGGYPGTFRDVGAAADLLRAQAARYGLDVGHVVAVGHSAGGHLALWLAARGGIPATSPLHAAHPIALHGAISLGGLPDLRAASVAPGDTCGTEAVEKLVGLAGPDRADVYADTSPAMLPQPRVPVALVNGSLDPIAPPAFADAYVARAAHEATHIVVPDMGHVELITPGTDAWRRTVALIERMLR